VDPALAAALAQYLATNCGGTISLSCGPGAGAGMPGPAMPSPRQQLDGCGCRQRECSSDCATSCPEPDYGNPDQPYFWDHTTMRM